MNLRQAAEALLNHWEAGEYKNCTGDMAGHIRVLREAAAQPEWVEELRGNTPDCKTHPDAPHGFDRNASHSADRYVCECEGWEPVDKVDMLEKRVNKSDKSIQKEKET